MKKIYKYQTLKGKIPFDDWLNKLDKNKKAKVLIRLERLKMDLYGNFRHLTNGISELKFKSGERIYFSQFKNSIILILAAGNKQRQSNDIVKAQNYLFEYTQRRNDE